MPSIGKAPFDLAVYLLNVKFVFLYQDHVNLQGAKPVNSLSGTPYIGREGLDLSWFKLGLSAAGVTFSWWDRGQRRRWQAAFPPCATG